MPIISVQLVAGRTTAQREALIAELTQAAVRVLAVPPTSVHVILNDVDRGDWGVAGITKARPAEVG